MSQWDWQIFSRWVSMAAALLTLAASTGCTSTLIVEGEFPTPLVEKIQLTAGVHYPDAFVDYEYVETGEGRAKWIILIGDAQQDMFDAVLNGMFAKVVALKTMPPWESAPGIDVLIAPLVDEFQYTLPTETKIKVYEIWLKYNVQVFKADGELLADWIITAYGKTPSGFMQSDEAAMNQAVVVALRDAGANLALNFSRVPEVRAWLGER